MTHRNHTYIEETIANQMLETQEITTTKSEEFQYGLRNSQSESCDFRSCLFQKIKKHLKLPHAHPIP